MGDIKFGRKQLGKPTPASFEFWAKIYIGVTGLILAWMPTNNLISHHVQDIITPIANLLNSIIIFLLPFFGVQVDSDLVPVEDVRTVESIKPDKTE